MSSSSELPGFWLENPVARSFLVSCSKCHFNDPRNYYWRPTKLQKHEGIDLAATNANGAPVAVLAAQRGIVDRVSTSARGYGTYVRLLHRWHDGTYVTWYAHLSQITVREGEYVNAGDQIGVAGSTGYTWGLPHLHLTLQKIGAGKGGYVIDDVVDPAPYFLLDDPPTLTEATFVEDISVSDGISMKPGLAFTKVWRVRNTGNVSWRGDYRLLHVDGSRMGAPTNVPLPAAKPGEEVDVAVSLVAPDRPGTYRSVWQPRDPDGKMFLNQFFTEIEVAEDADWTELSWVADVTQAGGAVVAPGQSFLKTWRLRNSGSTAWGPGYRLAHFADERLAGPDSVPLPEAAPGEEFDVSVSLAAPETSGVYRSTWKPVTPDGKYFEFAQYVEIEVPSPIPADEELDEARFVSDVTIPDGTTLRPGAAFTKTWRMRNSGTTTWGPGYEFVFFDDNSMGESRAVPLPEAKPGKTVDVSVDLVAPSAPGSHKSTWKPRNADGKHFDFAMYAEIEVAASIPDDDDLSELRFVADVTAADGDAIPPGYPFMKIWRVRNSGATTWGDGYHLKFAEGDQLDGPVVVPLPRIAPGNEAEIKMQLLAPTKPGGYRGVWKPHNAAGQPFSSPLHVDIVVMAPPTLTEEDEASLMESVTAPQNMVVRPGETFTKTWRVRNSGGSSWNGGYTLAFAGGAALNGPESVVLPATQPDKSAGISVTLTAPVRPGKYESTWRPRNPAGRHFGDVLPLAIEVSAIETHDMLVYMRGDGRIYNVRYTWAGGGTQHAQTQTDTGNDRGYYQVRDSRWEAFRYDDEYIYVEIKNTREDGTFLTFSDAGRDGSAWVPRHMAMHTFFRRSPFVTLQRKDDCRVMSRYSHISWIRLEAVHASLKLPGGLVLTNVAELAAFADIAGRPADAPYEHYLFARDYGLVAWQGRPGSFYMTGEPTPGSVLTGRRELIPCK